MRLARSDEERIEFDELEVAVAFSAMDMQSWNPIYIDENLRVPTEWVVEGA